MSHKTLTLNNVDPEAATTDNITPTSDKGFDPLVESYCGLSVALSALPGIGTGSDGEYLGYTSGTTTWEGKTVDVTASLGSYNWRYPSISNINSGTYYHTTGHRYHLGRKSGAGIVATELPASGTGPLLGFSYGGGPTNNTNWPTSFKVAAGHYLCLFSYRPWLQSGFNIELQPKNYTQGTYIGPRVEFNETTEAGPTTLVACFAAAQNDLVGIEVISGKTRLADEVWQIYTTIQLIKVG